MRKKMYRRKTFCTILTVAALQASLSLAVAQDRVGTLDTHNWEDRYSAGSSFEPSDSAQEDSALRRKEEGSRIANAASGRNNFNGLDSIVGNSDSNTYIGKFTNYNSWCKDRDDDDNCITDDPSLTLPHNTGWRIGSVNTIGPVGAVTDTLNSEIYVDQMTGALLSPSAVLLSTMNVTEPGLTLGVTSAINAANSAVSQRYQADHAIYYRLAANPGAGQMVAQMYENCLARGRAQGLSFPLAQSLCLRGDRATAAADDKLLSQDNLDRAPDGMMNFKSDPSHPNSDEGRLSGGYNDGDVKDNKIRALDYMFNLERNLPSGAINLADHQNSFDDLRRSFEDIIGDVEFIVSPPEAGGGLEPPNDETLPGIGTIEGTMSIKTRRIPPRVSSQKFFRNLVINRYRDFQALLHIECAYASTQQVNKDADVAEGRSEIPEMPKGESVSDRDSLEPSDYLANFWGDSNGAHQLMIRLSTAGFQPSPKLFDAVFGMFLDENSTEYDGDKDLIKISCERLGTGEGEPSNLFSLLSDSGQQGRKLALNTRDRFRSSFSISEKLAFGQYLGTLARAEEFVKELTGGAYDSLVRQYMLEMIYSVAGTSDIKRAIDLNDRQLREASVPIIAAYNVRNGLSAQGYQESLSSGGSDSNMASVDQR